MKNPSHFVYMSHSVCFPDVAWWSDNYQRSNERRAGHGGRSSSQACNSSDTRDNGSWQTDHRDCLTAAYWGHSGQDNDGCAKGSGRDSRSTVHRHDNQTWHTGEQYNAYTRHCGRRTCHQSVSVHVSICLHSICYHLNTPSRVTWPFDSP